jgi:hypothetical protein
VPDAWREPTVIPVPKSSRDRSLVTSYRPMSLTSCLCKAVEHMVNHQLVRVLEIQNLLSNAQCGFWHHRSTLDHLVNLEYHIQNAFLLHQDFVTVFFDLEKAYGTTWQYHIPRTLHRWNLRGWLPLFLSNFLQAHLPCPPQEYVICMLSSRKWSSIRINFKCDPVHNRHQWNG